ncbi:MAG: NTP transferase domain-containing protein [Chloroflexi bacterium]|nr:NTP transferase domain-containing protein [Chloroflexota bacterium]
MNTLNNYYAVIMAGGGGTRLWPLSRKAKPKQALRILGETTLFQNSIDRLEGLFPPERILIVTTAEQAALLQELSSLIPKENFILEPQPRGTASAIGLTAIVLRKLDPQASMAVLTADHFIGDEQLFRQVLITGYQVAKDNYLVTLGIQPTFPSTAYGYIQQGEKLGNYGQQEVYQALRFKEKPQEAQAEKMLSVGDHTWNSGMFIWKVENILAEIERQMPELFTALNEIAGAWGTPQQGAVLDRVWPELKSETVDYGIMEHAERLAVIPVAELGWNDVGSWDSLFAVLPTDKDGNIVNIEKHINVGSKNTLIHAERTERMIVTIGVKDLVIVDTDDVLLICSKDNAEEVRQVVEQLRKKKQNQFL